MKENRRTADEAEEDELVHASLLNAVAHLLVDVVKLLALRVGDRVRLGNRDLLALLAHGRGCGGARDKDGKG